MTSSLPLLFLSDLRIYSNQEKLDFADCTGFISVEFDQTCKLKSDQW
jgi:hypothetical protein